MESDEVVERLARLEVNMSDLKQDVAQILVQIQGPPREDSLRGRIHKVESSTAAAKAAEAALTIARDIHAQNNERRLGTGTKLVAAGCALLTVLCTVTTTVLLVAQTG